MGKSFFIISILCYISITSSDNFDRKLIGDENSETVLNTAIEYISSSSNIDQCVPVQAIKELGCILLKQNILLKGIFQTACEQHQLCYACGFAHHLTARKCNKLALTKMYDLCSRNETLPFSNCLKQRFSAIKLLRLHIYQSSNTTSPRFIFECHQQCVIDYLYTK